MGDADHGSGSSVCLLGCGVGLLLAGVIAPAADGVEAEDTQIEVPAVPNPDARFKLQIGDEEPIRPIRRLLPTHCIWSGGRRSRGS